MDTHDENRALRALSTHKPPAISKPAHTASFLSHGGAPEAQVGTRRRPFRIGWPVPGTLDTLLSTPQRADNVGSGLGASWAARRGAAVGLVWRCRIRKNGANILGVGWLSSVQDIAQHVSAERREMPPVCGPEHPASPAEGISSIEKNKNKARSPPALKTKKGLERHGSARVMRSADGR